MRPIKEKAIARAKGLTRYFDGRPCKYGHVAEHMVSGGACLECVRLRSASPRVRKKHAKWQKTKKGRAWIERMNIASCARAPEKSKIGLTSWASMQQRCFNPKNTKFHLYGARGITVCERWQGTNGSKNFLADMGSRPSLKHSIDRFPDNDGDYEPKNCRWATSKQQNSHLRQRAA